MTVKVRMFPTPESTNVAAIGYDNKERDLYVRFRFRNGNGNVYYRYDKVPPGTFVEFKDAASKGAYLNRSIKGKFTVGDVTHATGLVFIEVDQVP